MKRLLLIFVAVLLFQGCSSIEVVSDYDKSVNFRSFKTFNLQPLRVSSRANINEFATQRVQDAIASELKARGYRQVSFNADLNVKGHLITKQKHYTDSTTTYHSYRESTTRYNTYEYTEGSLTIDIRNPQTDRLLWQGVGMGTIDNNPKGQKERANKNIAKIFKGFPISKSE